MSLEDIKARADKATEGPWQRYGDLGFEVFSAAEYIDGEVGPYITEGCNHEVDAEFIANARQDVPKLVAALEAALDLCAHWDEKATGLEPGFERGFLIGSAHVLRLKITEALA